MQTRTVEQVESWDARPFSGEVRELHELADEGFSGTVVADDTWAFFLNGRVVGVFQGDIDDVIGTEGTVYSAPDSSLPLLFSMQERGGETRAKYFTNDTPVEEVDETLRDANFTGYLELSENVLSGDYYISYYGGKSLSTAFVGQSDRLVTGEEAFEMVNDEVGVFEVHDVSFGITELPKIDDDPEPEDAADEPVAESSVDSGDSSMEDAASDSDADTASDAESDSGSEAKSDAETAAATAAVENEPADGPAETDTSPSEGAEQDIQDAESSTDPGSAEAGAMDDAATAADPTPSADEPPTESPSTEAAETTNSPSDDEAQTAHERAVREWAAKDRAQRDDEGQNDLFREEAEWRKTSSIPALDPDESRSPDVEGTGTDTRSGPSSTRRPTSSQRQTDAPVGENTGQRGSRSTKSGSSPRREGSTPSTSASRSGSSRDRSSESETSDTESTTTSESPDPRIDQLESELSTIESKRDDLEDTVSELREERSSLEERIDTLESKLETAERDSAIPSSTGPGDLRSSEAIAGTNVFVRYNSKGKPTLDALDGSSVDPDTVNQNLRLDHHTTFEATEATVEGRPYEEFLHDSSRFKFVEWLVRELPYELLDSGARQDLEKVYDAIPRIDRVEFDGTVEVESDDEGASSFAFDVVVRDRMGNPLVVADTNDARDPVDRDSMDELVSGATAVGTANDSLAGAFYVTTSYFDPKALERAQDAADEGGFFSRSGKESFVKVGRKRGYHLCLVEDRRDSFHVTVPEL